MFIRLAAAATAATLLCAPAALADTTTTTPTISATTPTISVNGTGSVFLAPDVASLNVDVTRSAPTSRAALGAANARTDAVVAAVRAAGVPASGIQTNTVQVSPGAIFVGRRHHRHLVHRYTATESLSITTTSALVGAVIDASVHAGATDVNGPNFSFSDPTAGMEQATNAALADARRRADAAAATLGYTVTGVEAVNLDPGSGVVTPTNGASAAPPAAKTPAPTTVHPGTQEVDANVTVVFTIAPA